MKVFNTPARVELMSVVAALFELSRTTDSCPRNWPNRDLQFFTRHLNTVSRVAVPSAVTLNEAGSDGVPLPGKQSTGVAVLCSQRVKFAANAWEDCPATVQTESAAHESRPLCRRGKLYLTAGDSFFVGELIGMLCRDIAMFAGSVPPRSGPAVRCGVGELTHPPPVSDFAVSSTADDPVETHCMLPFEKRINP